MLITMLGWLAAAMLLALLAIGGYGLRESRNVEKQ
jgi:hypothetical protein